MRTAPDLRPLGIGEILDVAIKLYFRNFVTLLKAVVLPLLIVGGLGLLITLSLIPEGTVARDGQLIVPTEEDLAVLGAAGGLGALLSWLGTILATGAAFRALSEAYLGREPDAGASIGFAARRLHSIVWVSVLTAVLAGLAAILFIIPGIYLLVAFAVAVPVLLVEGRKGTKALGRSRDLVRGRWWPTAGTMFFGTWIIPFIFALLVGLVFQGILVTSADSATAQVAYTAIGDTIATILVDPFAAAVTTVLYFDLRVRKEGFDLQLLAESIGSSPPAPTSASPAPIAPPTPPSGPEFPPPSTPPSSSG